MLNASAAQRSQASASDASVRHHGRCGRRANGLSFERQGPRPQSQLLTLSGACASPHQTSKSSAAFTWRRQDNRELLKSLRCRIAGLSICTPMRRNTARNSILQSPVVRTNFSTVRDEMSALDKTISGCNLF